jgi:Mg-chelatase subunit ChlD
MRWILLSVIGIALIITVTLIAFAEATTYSGVTFPHGDRSFADRVVSYVAASCADGGYDDPRAALGPPDCGGEGCHACQGCDTCAVALGFRLSELDNRGNLVLEFVDNTLVDVEGDDLFIYITNRKACLVEISTNGSHFIPVGTVTGYPGKIDISPFVTPGEEFCFVRLSDLPADEDKSCCPGPSIDAVGAMGPLRMVEETGEASGFLMLQAIGELALRIAQAPQDLLIILDSSSSMGERFEYSTKIEVAREVLKEFVADLPDEMRVGLRIFGGCEYSQLLRPIEPLNRASLQAQIQSIETGGKTPLAYTLEQAKGDFVADLPGAKLILLVSDGIETCGGDPVASAWNLLNSGYDLQINVVGFDIGEMPGAREQLMEIAKVTGGTYYDAQSSEELRMALRLSDRITYSIYDQQGEKIATGVIGGQGEPGKEALKPGVYRVVFDTSPTTERTVTIEPGQTKQIELALSNGGYSAEVK